MKRRKGAGAALSAFILKEIRHILRDRQTLIILLLLPLAQLVLFGYAVRTDIHDVRVAVVGEGSDHATSALRNRFAGNGRFRIVGGGLREDELHEAFARGDMDVAVLLEPDVTEKLARGVPTRVLIVSDAADPNTGATMQNYAGSVIADWQDDIGANRGLVQIKLERQMRFNPTLESVNLFVPGLIALILTMVTSIMTAISLSREKERGTFEVLLVSPLRPWQIILGKVAPYLILAMMNVVTVLLAAWLVFNVPFRGSLTLLLAASTLYALVGLAIGVLIAAVTSSQIAAMLAALGATMLPNIMLSGMVFPIASLPLPLRLISNIVPARWFIELCRGIMIKGIGFQLLWENLAILALMLMVFLFVAIKRTSVRLA